MPICLYVVERAPYLMAGTSSVGSYLGQYVFLAQQIGE